MEPQCHRNIRWSHELRKYLGIADNQPVLNRGRERHCLYGATIQTSTMAPSKQAIFPVDHQPVDHQPQNESDRYEEFLRLFTRDQRRVVAYIQMLIHDRTVADDVFQETSLVLWRSFSSFRPEAEFIPWALGIARHQVLRYWRTQRRDRHVFSESLVSELADDAIGLIGEIEPRQESLDRCVEHLTDRQRGLIQMFYGENQSASLIAVRWNRSVHAVYKALKVMRRSLLECVEQKLAEEIEQKLTEETS